jgi:hypothetical protein
LVALYPVSLAFAILEKTNSTEKKHIRFSFWTALSLLFFIVLIFTRSRSGLAGIAAASVIFWTGAWYFFTQNRRIVRNFFIGLHITIFVFLFFHGSNVGRYDQYLTLRGLRARFEASQVQDAAPQTATDTLLVTGGTESGTIRRFVWQGALNAWRSSTKTFLIGTGTESFAFAFYQFKSKEHNMTSEWDFLYNKAHNEYLNYLATTGIFGLGSYVLFVGTFVIWFFKNQMSKLKAQSNVKAQSLKNSLTVGFDSTFVIRILPIALFVGWLSVLVTNFFGFSVVVTQLFLFLFPAMIITITRGESVQQFRHLSLPLRPGAVSLARGLIGVFGLLLVLRLASVWYADMSYAAGYRLARAGSYERSKDFLSRAIALLPSEPLYHDEMSTTLAALTTAAIEDSKNATRAAELAQAAMQESDRALTVSPKNVNFWKSRTKILYSFSSFNPELNKAAIDALKNAQMLSPTDPKIAYNLAILWGREGDNGQAIDLLKQAIDLKPNYRDAYYALFVFYTDTGQIPVARTILTQYLTDVDPKDQDFQDKLKQL